MLRLNWDNIAILVVDDNAFMRNLIVSTLRALGMTNLVAKSGAAEAIQALSESRRNPASAGFGTIDIILSDFVMEEVDGALFLRWIRTSKQAPDRFVPFLMCSGAADQKAVEASRDAGVSEFLAKPFSAKSMGDRILEVIKNPRQYVLAPGYFRPANRLRDKLGPNALRGQIDFDPLVIQAAEARIHEMVGDYAVWVKKYLDTMGGSYKALCQRADDPKLHMVTINQIAHELRGQGGIFDYPLLTSFGRSLYHATLDSRGEITENRLKLIEAHIDALRVVFNKRVHGNGGNVGAELLKDIERAVKKYGDVPVGGPIF
jgi:CheY-like chemotaxis protein